MDSPDRFHDHGVHGGFYTKREDAEAWIEAMLEGDAPKTREETASKYGGQEAHAVAGQTPEHDVGQPAVRNTSAPGTTGDQPSR